jgi:hypothetical protein
LIWESIILVLLGVYSEAAKKSMLSPHRSGNTLILVAKKVSKNHQVQRQYFGTLTLVNTTFSATSYARQSFSGAMSNNGELSIITHTADVENMAHLWSHLLASCTNAFL